MILEGPITDKIGHYTTGEEEKMFQTQETPNKPALQDKIYFNMINEMDALNIEMGDINKTKMIHAIRNMKNNKAAGENAVTTEMLKESGEENIDILVKLFNQMRKNENFPIDWRSGFIIKLPEKQSEKL